MNLNEMKYIDEVGTTPPDCVVEKRLDGPLPNIREFSTAVLALTFPSGSPQNPSAISYVFYFFRGDVDPNRRPDDILTFKIRFADPSKIHIIDKYLGGMAMDVENAPPLSQRAQWRPGMMSAEGQQRFQTEVITPLKSSKQESSGCFIATAAYGSRFEPDVRFLRAFRDRVLLKMATGRLFVRTYYLFSPAIARIISKSRFFQSMTKRFFLQPLLRLLKIKNEFIS